MIPKIDMGAYMKRFFLTTLAIAALAGPATAADMAIKAPPAPVFRPACAQFAGGYLGGQVGGAFYDHDWRDLDAWTQEVDSGNILPTNTRSTKWGAAGGATLGWNWQTNCTVFSVEADYSWTSLNASSFITDGAFPVLDDSVSITSKLSGFGTVRTRAGVVVDNVLIYVTGGLAFADFKRTFTLNQDNGTTVETFASNRWRWGLAVGAGTEWAFNSNWSIKSEFLYLAFQKDNQTFVSNFFDTGDQKRFESHDSVWVSRIGLNYRWGGTPTRF